MCRSGPRCPGEDTDCEHSGERSWAAKGQCQPGCRPAAPSLTCVSLPTGCPLHPNVQQASSKCLLNKGHCYLQPGCSGAPVMDGVQLWGRSSWLLPAQLSQALASRHSFLPHTASGTWGLAASLATRPQAALMKQSLTKTRLATEKRHLLAGTWAEKPRRDFSLRTEFGEGTERRRIWLVHWGGIQTVNGGVCSEHHTCTHVIPDTEPVLPNSG